jgi:hypothetical protein
MSELDLEPLYSSSSFRVRVFGFEFSGSSFRVRVFGFEFSESSSSSQVRARVEFNLITFDSKTRSCARDWYMSNHDNLLKEKRYSLSRREESCQHKLFVCLLAYLLACLYVRRGSKKHKG